MTTAMRSDLRSFFESYRDAFNGLDAEAITGHYCVPSMLTNRQGQVVWTETPQIHANMIAICEYYRASGFVSAQFEPLECIDQPPDHAVVELLWTIQRSDNRPSVPFRTGYNVRRQSTAWGILLCTAYDEDPFPAAG